MLVHIISLESLVQAFEFAPVFILFPVCSIMFLRQVSSIVSFSRTRREFRSRYWARNIEVFAFVIFLCFSNHLFCTYLDFGQQIATRLTLTLIGA